MLIKFNNVSDKKYFLSHDAGHQDWLKMYSFKIINDNTIFLDDKFMQIIDFDVAEKCGNIYKMKKYDCDQNKKIIFTKDVNGEEISFLDSIQIIY